MRFSHNDKYYEAICFSTGNNDCANNGNNFNVSVCESCVNFFALFSPKAQEIDVPLASMGRLASESELHMFSPEGKHRNVLRGQVCITSHLV